MIELIIVAVLFLITLGFIYLMNERLHSAEIERFREFVRAIKSKDVIQYNEAIPEKDSLEVTEPEELVELDQVEPQKLLKIIKQNESHQSTS